MKVLAYDLEIINAIPNRNEVRNFNLNYCSGWTDYSNMGISTLCAYDFHERRYRTFDQSNMLEFLALIPERVLVSYNGIAFDNKVIAHTWGMPDNPEALESQLLTQSYDLLLEIKAADGLSPNARVKGYKLDDCARVNFGEQKSASGAMAPVWWQEGYIGRTIDYCLQDVKLTANLFVASINGGLKSPVTGELICLAMPPSPYTGVEGVTALL